MTSDGLKVAIVHDWLPVVAGAEKVVTELAVAFPQSEIFTLFDFLSEEERRILSGGKPVHVSYLNSLPGVRHYYRYLLMQCTRAIERFDLSDFDAVISSSAALAKGAITSPDQPHIAYVHSPARYAWDLTHEYLRSIGGIGSHLKRAVAHRMLHDFRIWDIRTVAQVDCLVANSEFIRKRIYKTYRREARVIYPPVDTAAFVPGTGPRQDFYFTASRMVPYKHVPLIVAAFSRRPDLRLVVGGDGPEMPKVKAVAGPNVTIMGQVSFDQMREQMQKARAFVFAAKEDFGIVPVEAQACGCPVIALNVGGTAETVRDVSMDRPTGLWFHDQTVEGLLQAVDRFEAEGNAILSADCRANALNYRPERFRSEIADCVMDTYARMGRTGA